MLSIGWLSLVGGAILSLRPSVLNVLLLPYDYIAVFSNDECIEILDGNNNSLIGSDNA